MGHQHHGRPNPERDLKIISHPLHKIGIVFNPFAGGLKGANRARLDRAVQVFRNAGREVSLYPTQAPGQAGDLARQAISDGCQLILAAGGDGTINETVNGMVGSRTVFGALPAGTANVLANEVGLPNRPDHAAKFLLDSVPTRIALGGLDIPGKRRRHFALMAGIGLDARIVRELDLDLKMKYGKLAYWHAGLRQLGRSMERFHAEVNGQKMEASFVLVTSVRNYGGDFEIAKNVRITDDDFEVIIFQRHAWYDYVRAFGSIVTNSLYKTKGVTVCRATEVRLSAIPDQDVYMQVDGEELGPIPARIFAVPDALTLLLPKRYVGNPASN